MDGGALVWKIRRFFKRVWLKSFHLGGGFRQSESSARATLLTDLWAAQWPDEEPIGYLLRGNHADRRVRFHSLPESKRYATTVEERAEILRRNHIVLGDLLAGSGGTRIRIIGEDFDVSDNASGQLKKHLPGAWPWRKYLEPDDYEPGEDFRFRYFWVSSIESVDELDELLALVADNACRFIVTDAELTWIFAPYDGGSDVILPSSAVRDELAFKHRGWISVQAEGL